MNPCNPMLTVITVVRNDRDGLSRTIRSIAGHKRSDIEYVVIDGASSDGTLELIMDHEELIDLWISEPDSGIYDAMNKGIARSSGEYLLFLNAGDELVADLDQLSDILADGYAMVYGKANMIRPDGILSYVKGKPLRSIGKLVRGTPLCHQAILYKRDAIGLYDTRYRIIADRVLTYELVKRYGLERTRFVDLAIANYYEGGFSRQHVREWKREELAFLIQHRKVIVYFFKKISLILYRRV